MFKHSAAELKSIRCLTVTGVLVACYVVLNSPLLSYNTEVLKITFGYLALAAIGMLYGPVVAIIAAIPCDIVTALTVGLGVNPFFTLPKILEGLIYGILLYGYARRTTTEKSPVLQQIGWASWQVMRIVFARLLVVVLCHFILNSFLVLFIVLPPGRAEEILTTQSFWVWAFARSGVKNIIQFPVDLAMMFVFLPVLGTVHNKLKIHSSERHGRKA